MDLKYNSCTMDGDEEYKDQDNDDDDGDDDDEDEDEGDDRKKQVEPVGPPKVSSSNNHNSIFIPSLQT